MLFKDKVEAGKYIPEEVWKMLEAKTELTEEEKEIYRRAAILVKRRKKIAWLRTEASIADLDLNIKKALNNSNPQIDKCTEYLAELLQLDLECQEVILYNRYSSVNCLVSLIYYSFNLLLTSGARWPRSLVITNHLSAILMGVVRQAVNRSAAASSGFMGSSWSLPHAASWIQFL